MLIIRMAAIALAAAVTAAPAAPVSHHPAPAAAHYCALMTDSIGLYQGNAVTRRGVPVGTIEKIDGGTMSVQVTFRLNRGIAVPAEVQAVTRTPTILADRALELVGGDSSVGELQPGSCIPLERTSTARANSATIGAITTLLNQLNGAHGDTVNRLVGAASSQLVGNGPAIAEMLSLFAGVFDHGVDASPAQPIRQAATLLSAATANWDTIETSVRLIPPLMTTIGTNVVKPLADIVGLDLDRLVSFAVDLATVYHDLLWNTLDTATATTRLLSQHTGVIVTYGGTFPNMMDWIRKFWAIHMHFNPVRPIPVLSPRVDAGGTDDGMVCARLRPAGKNHCGLFHGVPPGMTTAELLDRSLHGGANRP